MTKTKQEIRDTIESYLEDWDRAQWMQDHGTWASERWQDEREDYDEALAKFREAVDALPDGDGVCYDTKHAFASLEVDMAELKTAMEDLDGQVHPDESDFIAEGTIDPEGVKGGAESLHVDSNLVQGWDCTEGWAAYRHGDALVMHWFRDAQGARHERDLWVVVDGQFFAEEEA